MPRESGVERYLVDEAKARGGFAFKMTGYLGIPDRLVLLNGCAAFAEMKTPKGALSPAQRIQRRLLIGMGFNVWTPRTREQVDTLLNHMAMTGRVMPLPITEPDD